MMRKDIMRVFTYISWFLMIFASIYAALAVNETAATFGVDNTVYSYPSFNINIEKSYSACAGSETVIFPRLTNYADFPDTFILEVMGNDFAGLTVNNIEIASMSRTEIPIVIEPQDEGLFDLHLIAQDIYGYFAEGKTVVYVDNCLDRILDIENPVVKLVNCESKSYPIILSNNGNGERTYKIDFIGPEWTSLDLPGAVKLEPGQYKEFNMNVDVPCDVKGNFEAEITVSVPGEEFDLKNKQRIKIEVYGKNEAYKAGQWYNHPFMIIPKVFVGFIALFIIYGIFKNPLKKFAAWHKKKKEESKVKKEEKKKIKTEKKAAMKLLKENKEHDSAAMKKIAEEQGIPLHPRRKWVILGAIIAVIVAVLLIFGKTSIPFIIIYRYYILAGLVLLALLIVILSAVRKHTTKRKTVVKEEVADKLEKTKEKKKNRWVNIVGLSFLLVILIGSAVFYYLGNPFIRAPDNEFVKIDSDNVVVRNGRIIAKGDSVIPLIVDDKNGGAKFNIDSTVSWIRVDDSELETNNDVKRIYLYVTPTEEVSNQNYLVEVNANIDYNNQIINEHVAVELINTQEFMGTYASYVFAGLILAVILSLVSPVLRKLKERKPVKKTVEEDVFVFDPKTMKASEMLQKQKKQSIDGLKKGKEKVRKGLQHYVAVELREKLV